MNKVSLSKPVLITLYGFPGSGKTYVSRQLSDELSIPHLSADRIRAELFEQPSYSRQENKIVEHLMKFMTQEFLKAGISVIFDINAFRQSQRIDLRNLARVNGADSLLIWIQIDPESALARVTSRDRRTSDDRYSMEHNENSFTALASGMQHPNNEDYLVISGKHNFATQRSAILNKLFQRGLVGSGAVQKNVTKPGLVNLVPNPKAGRVDMDRRNIVIG